MLNKAPALAASASCVSWVQCINALDHVTGGDVSRFTEPTSSGAGSVDIDLDVITSRDVTALNTAAARHKIAVKPKSKRPASQFAKRVRQRANSPVSGATIGGSVRTTSSLVHCHDVTALETTE